MGGAWDMGRLVVPELRQQGVKILEAVSSVFLAATLIAFLAGSFLGLLNVSASAQAGAALLALASAFAAFRLFRALARSSGVGSDQVSTRLDVLNNVLNSMPHGVALYDANQNLVLANRQYEQMYGLAQGDLTPGMNLRQILEKRAKAGVFCGEDPESYIVDRLSAMEMPTGESRIDRFSDGRVISKTRNLMPNGGWLSIHEDITDRQRAEDKIIYLAHNDVLTGLFNRTVLLERIELALAQTRRTGRPYAIFLVDLDNFKSINDNLGHLVGDKVLQAVASRLQAAVREVDTVARLGGDEFAILQDCGDDAQDGAGRLAQRILQLFDEVMEIDGFSIPVHVSIGVALAPGDGDDSATLQRNADIALYKAKDAGRGCVRFFDPEMDSVCRLERALEFDLRQALMTEEFELHYQAVVNVRSLRAVSAEALVRWRHPTLGMVPPDRFIKIAEKTGLINLLGEWVMNTACEDAMRWPSNISVAVNLSPAQFKSGSIVDMVRNALATSNLPASRLILEITESTLLENTDDNLNTITRLRALGVRIALDDFGTGYSSLSYLRTIPFDVVKIDRSFVVAMATSTRSESIVAAMVALSRSLNFTTVAEGIETHEQFERVRAAGCTTVQGYLFAKPKAASELDFDQVNNTALNEAFAFSGAAA